MPLTAAEQAEYDALAARFGPLTSSAPAAPAPLEGGILSRIGQQAANYIPNVAEGLLHSAQAFVNYPMPEGGALPLVNVPKPYNIAPARTTGEKVVDVGAEIAQVIPQFVIPETAATGVFRLAGAGEKAARIGGGTLGWGFAAAEQDMQAAGANAAMGAMQGVADFMPRKQRAILAAGTGLITGIEAARTGSSDMEAGVWGAVGAGLVFATPQIKQALARQAETSLAQGVADGATPAPTGSPGTMTPADNVKRPSMADPAPIIGQKAETPGWLQGPQAYQQRTEVGGPAVIDPTAPRGQGTVLPPDIGGVPSMGIIGQPAEPNAFRIDAPDIQARILENQQPRTRYSGTGEIEPMLAPIQMDIPLSRRIAPEQTPVNLLMPDRPGPGTEFFPEMVPERYRNGINRSATPEPEPFDLQSLVPEQYRSGVKQHGPEIAPLQVESPAPTTALPENAYAEAQALRDSLGDAEAARQVGLTQAHIDDFMLGENKTGINPHGDGQDGLTLEIAKRRQQQPPEVATLQKPAKEAPHPQTKLPSGLQRLLKDAPGWTAPGENLKSGFTEDAFALGAMAKTDKDVERLYNAAARMEERGMSLMDAETIEGVMAAQEFVSKAQYLREAAEFAEGAPGKLEQFVARDPNYRPPVPSQAYLDTLRNPGKPKVPVAGEERLIDMNGEPSEAIVTDVTDGKVTYEVFDEEVGDVVQKVATLQEFDRLSKVDEFKGFEPTPPKQTLPPKPAPVVEAPKPTVVESDYDQLKRLAAEKRAREEANAPKYSTHTGSSSLGTQSATSLRVNRQYDELDTFRRQAFRDGDPAKLKAAEKELDALLPKVLKQMITDMYSADAARRVSGGQRYHYYSATDIYAYMDGGTPYNFPALEKPVNRKSLAHPGETYEIEADKAAKAARLKKVLEKMVKDGDLDRLTGLNKRGKEGTVYHLPEAEENAIYQWAKDEGHLFYTDYPAFRQKYEEPLATAQKVEPPPPKPAPTVPDSNTVRVNHQGRWVEAKVVGVEDGTYHVRVDDPIRGELDVFTRDVKQAVTNAPETPKHGVPFQDVPGAKTRMDSAYEKFYTRVEGGHHRDMPDRVAIDFNTATGRQPIEQTLHQALAMLSPRSSMLMQTVIARLQTALGQNLKLRVSGNLGKGIEARAFATGDTAISHTFLSGAVKNWDNMTEAAQANAALKVTKTIAHEVAHIATRYGEKTGLTYNGQRLTDAVTSLVHRIPLRNREEVIRQIQQQHDLPDFVRKYLAGDMETVHAHYSKSRPGISKEQSARLAAEEFMVELATVELHKRMDTTGLPQAFRDVINKFKQVLVNVMEWLSGNGQKVATLQDLSKLTEKVLDHYKGATKGDLHYAFPDRTSIPTNSFQTPRDMPASTVVPDPATPFVRDQMIRLGIRTATGAILGGGGSTLSDGEVSLIEGILAGGALGAFGPAAAKRIAQTGGLSDAFKKANGNPLKAYRNVMNGESFKDRLRSLGAEARFETGSGLAKAVRFLEAELGVNLDPILKGAVEHARGLAAEMAQIIQDALDKARWYQPSEHINIAALQYLEGNGTKADFLATLTTDADKAFGTFIVTAREGTTRLSEMFAAGMADGKFKSQVIANKDKYLGRFYRAFHSGEFDMTKFDDAKKDLMTRFPDYSPEVADSILMEYMREVQANRTIFRRRGNAGQKIDASLHRRRLVTEQEIEDQMLHVADMEVMMPGTTELKDAQARLKWMQGHQITDNWRAWMGEYTGAKERALLTFAKLHPTSVSAKVYDILANSVDQFGLKFAYDAVELSKKTEAIKARLSMAPPADEVATLQKQLKELEAFVPLPTGASYGKLSGKFTNRFVRDEIATYSTPFKFMEQPILRGIASFNNVVKVSRTALNPITVIRNYLQMPVFGLIAKTGVRDIREAFTEIHKTKGDLYKLMLREGITTSDFVASELTKGPGWMFSGYADSDIAMRVARYGYEKALDVYRQPDMLIRAGAFISARKRFASQLHGTATPTAAQLNDPAVIAKARDFTNRYTMNYDTVPRIVKLGRQLPFVSLFISYTAEITRIMKNLTQDAINPTADSAGRMHAIGVLSGMAAIPALMTNAFESSLSERDKEDWDKVKRLSPHYSRSRFQIPYKRDEKGRFHYFDITNLIPIDSYAQMVKAASAGDYEAAIAANPVASLQNTPLLNIAVEQITGEDLHTAKPVRGFDRVTEVMKEVLPPVIPPGYEGERLQRAFARNDQGTLGTENMKTGVQVKPSDIIANYLTGMRFANVTLSNIQSRFVAQTKREIAEHQAILRDVMRTNARPEVKAQAQENYNRSVTEIVARMGEKIGVTPTP